MECSGKGRRGTRWHRGDVKKVGVWLQRCYLFSAALSKVQSSTGASDPIGSFFTYGTMGGMGLSRQNRDKYWKGCRARKKEKATQQIYNCPHRSKKKPEISTNAQPKTSPWVEGRATFAMEGHKFPNDVFALIGRSLHRLLSMAMPCANCLMPLRGVIA